MDDYDTDLGNRAVDEDLTYTVTIHTITTVNTEDDPSGLNVNVIKKLRSAKTGDTIYLALWITFAAVSAGVIIFLIFKRKKERNDEKKQ